MKKVLFILEDFYPVKGAPAVRINSFVKEFKDCKVEILGGSSEKIHRRGWHLIHRPSERNLFAFIWFLIKMNIKSVSLTLFKRYDLVVVSIPKYETLLSFPLVKLLSKKVVLDIRDSFEFLRYDSYFKHFFPRLVAEGLGAFVKNYFVRGFLNVSFKLADLITVANKGIKNSISELDNVHVVSNGVDVKMFSPKGKKKKSSLQLVYLGNYSEKDRFHWILNVVPRFNVTLNLIGDGRCKKKILKKLKERNVNFVDHGFVKHENLPRILSSMDLGFIFRDAEINESIPVSVYEFCSMNVPTLVNDVGIMSKFVKNNKLGYVLKSQEDFQVLMKRLVNDGSELKKFSNLHSLAVDNFSRKKEAEKFKSLVLN